jgi:hypothetical protein
MDNIEESTKKCEIPAPETILLRFRLQEKLKMMLLALALIAIYRTLGLIK